MGSPGAALKLFVIWVMYSSPLSVTAHHHHLTPLIHSTSSLLALPLGSKSTGSLTSSNPADWLSIPAWATSDPREAHTTTPTNLAMEGALPQLLSTRPHHCVLEGTQSTLSRHPLSRLGVRWQHPHFTLPAGRRDDAD